MNNSYYYKTIYNFSNIWAIGYTFIFFGGLVIRMYHDIWRVSNLLYFLIGIAIFFFVGFCFPIFDMLKLIFKFNHDQRKHRWEQLNEHLLIIDSYYKPNIKTGSTFKSSYFNGCQIAALLFLNRIDEGIELYDKTILDYGEYFSPMDKVKFLNMHIQLEIEKRNTDVVEEEISRCGSLIAALKNEKNEKIYRRMLLYKELKLQFLKEEYEGLEQKIKKLIDDEKISNNIISYKYFLGEVCLKKKKYVEAIDAFSYVVNADKKHHKYVSAKKYYQQLVQENYV